MAGRFDDDRIFQVIQKELRWGRCHGLVGWLDEPPRTKKIMHSSENGLMKNAWLCVNHLQDAHIVN
jgi:hypothetical protein